MQSSEAPSMAQEPLMAHENIMPAPIPIAPANADSITSAISPHSYVSSENNTPPSQSVKIEPLIKDEASIKEGTESPILHPGMPMALKDPNANPRRPPRKSTLTQQQKNNKRQRATQDQLGTLEIEFNKNPTPTAAVRERIADEINMTERSVQIWFQNRRAKIKNLAKKSIETGEDCDAIPESMRRYLAMQAFESGKPLMQGMMHNGPYAPFGNPLIMNADTSNSKVLISHLACRSLEIGTWRRVAQNHLDLVVFYSPEVSKITYYINAESSGFKIEYPFSFIKSITMDNGDPSAGAEGASQRTGGLIVELSRPPTFSMDQCQGGWFQCGDFTENRQASQVLTHYLGGHPKVLSGQLAKLMTLDSFRNRHRMPDPTMLAVPIPVSPIGPMRPASQPNHLVHPHHPPPPQPFPDGAAPNLMAPPAPPRGHKRQRSQSVPAALDFSQLRQPPRPFYNGAMPDPAPHFIHHHHHTFAPIPQRSFSTGPPPQMDLASPMAPPTLDTSGISFDFHAPPPMSATTVDSDAGHFKYGAAGFVEPGTAPLVTTPFSNPFLSPVPDSMSQHQSASPHSALSNTEPLIADSSSPFFNDIGRSASADLFTPYDGGDMGDASFGFGDMNSKHPFVLPFRGPDMDMPNDDFDFQTMINMPGPESMSPSELNAELDNMGASGASFTTSS